MATKNNRRRLSISRNEYKPIRIRPYWKLLESSTLISDEQINSVKEIVSAGITYFESFITVIPCNGPLYYPRSCDIGESVSYFGPTTYYYNCKTYDIITKCGAAVIPSTHFREDWKYYIDGAVDTNIYPSGTGLIDADLVLYITAESLFCTTDTSNNGAIAWSMSCVQDQNGRPIFATINFCPSQSIGIEWKHDIITIIHELTHILGFDASLYPYYINKYGETIDYDNIIASNIQSINGDMINKWIITPTVKSMAQIYFNCTDLIGIPLENDGDNIGSSHWEQHFLNTEYMLKYTDNTQVYVSIFTLALLQDTGWYHIDFNYAQPQFKWGYKMGCKFFKTKCFNLSDTDNGTSNYKQYFCNPNIMKSTYCTVDSLSLGFCVKSLDIPTETKYKYFGNNGFYGYYSTEYCPYIDSFYSNNNNQTNFNFQCFDLNGNILDNISSNYVPWIYSLSSRCVNTKTSLIENNNQTVEHSAFCFPMVCNQYDSMLQRWSNIDIIIGNSTVKCFRDDTLKTKIIIHSGYQYSIICPDIDTICINEKPFECQYGAWNDEENKCFCQSGYIDDHCQSELRIISDEVKQYNDTIIDDMPYSNDLCAFLIDNDNVTNNNIIISQLLLGTWTYNGYDDSNRTIYPNYKNGDYYLYFDGWYHTWNIGRHLNDYYSETTVLATCDIGERPFDVTDCNHLFYFTDDYHYLWTQNLYFILLHGNCDNQSVSCPICDNFNISQWTVNSFHIDTPSPLITSTLMMNETNNTNVSVNGSKLNTNINEMLVIIAVIVLLCIILFICIGGGIYYYHTMKNNKLRKQLNNVKQDLVKNTNSHIMTESLHEVK